MIPNLPLDTNPLEVPKFYSAIADNLRSRLGHHENWWTHKRDPSVCPICDIIELSIRIGNELEMFISKSALDLDDQFLDSSTIDEGEESLNRDDENGNHEDSADSSKGGSF